MKRGRASSPSSRSSPRRAAASGGYCATRPARGRLPGLCRGQPRLSWRRRRAAASTSIAVEPGDASKEGRSSSRSNPRCRSRSATRRRRGCARPRRSSPTCKAAQQRPEQIAVLQGAGGAREGAARSLADRVRAPAGRCSSAAHAPRRGSTRRRRPSSATRPRLTRRSGRSRPAQLAGRSAEIDAAEATVQRRRRRRWSRPRRVSPSAGVSRAGGRAWRRTSISAPARW